MTLRHELRRRFRSIIVPTLGAVVVGYFLLHAIEGERGVRAWAQLRAEIAAAERVHADLAAGRERLEARIALLRSDNLDADLLDERARAVAGLARADDRVILLTPADGW